jgi:arylsulfatase A-like enzyme
LNPVARAVLSCLPATLTYHRGLALGETPNIDRIGQEGAVFTDYYAM